MKSQNGFFDFEFIIVAIVVAIIVSFCVYPPGKWDAKDEQMQQVNEVLVKSRNQPFAKDIKKLALESQKDGSISRDEADLILKEYEKQSLKLSISQLN